MVHYSFGPVTYLTSKAKQLKYRAIQDPFVAYKSMKLHTYVYIHYAINGIMHICTYYVFINFTFSL